MKVSNTNTLHRLCMHFSKEGYKNTEILLTDNVLEYTVIMEEEVNDSDLKNNLIYIHPISKP